MLLWQGCGGETDAAKIAHASAFFVLARDYRDAEQLSIAEIARRLRRAEAAIKAYLCDPTGEKSRADRSAESSRPCGSESV